MQSARNIVASEQNRDFAFPAPNGPGLMELWLILAKRKYVLAATMLAILGAALVYLQVGPTHYQFRTPIQLAKTPDGPIESLETIIAKLQESFVPLVSSKTASSKGITVPDVTVKNPGGGDIIILESVGELDDAENIEVLHKAVVDEVVQSHKEIEEKVRVWSEAKLTQLETRLAQLLREEALLAAELARLEGSEKVIGANLVDERRRIEQLETARSERVNGSAGEDTIGNLLLVDIAKRQHEERLARFEERLNVSLAQRKDSIQKNQITNFREQDHKKDEIRQLQEALSRSRTTTRMAPSLLLKRKTKMGGVAVISLSLLLGAVAGIFVVYFCEFVARAQAYEKIGGAQRPNESM